MIRRREFITLVGGAAATWPLTARAQQPERMRRIGVLAQGAANDPEVAARLTAFVQGLQELGWSVGRNARIDYRWAAANWDLTQRYAAELVALGPDVILAAGGLTVRPLLDLTTTVPIVFDALDPVGGGFVASLSRPGGNATGFGAIEYGMSGKWLELLKQIAPHITRVAVLRDPINIASIGQFSALYVGGKLDRRVVGEHVLQEANPRLANAGLAVRQTNQVRPDRGRYRAEHGLGVGQRDTTDEMYIRMLAVCVHARPLISKLPILDPMMPLTGRSAEKRTSEPARSDVAIISCD